MFPLTSIEIKNFRTFPYLKIEELAQVNLVTGKNNVGKTTLLEAVHFYAYHGSPHVLRQVVDPREFKDFAEHLFYRFNSQDTDGKQIIIGPISPPGKQIKFVIDEDDFLEKNISIDYLDDSWTTNAFYVPKIEDEQARSYFLQAGIFDNYSVHIWWDDIVLTQKEACVVEELKFFEPKIEKIALISEPKRNHRRSFKAKIEGIKEPISFESLGGGVNHFLGIIIAVLSADDGILLIDEIENGIHYSIQTDMWQLILKLAKRYNVQVFATTHSWDCITAFQQAIQQSKDDSSQLIRLSKENHHTYATLFNVDDLAIITQRDIEVR